MGHLITANIAKSVKISLKYFGSKNNLLRSYLAICLTILQLQKRNADILRKYDRSFIGSVVKV